MVGAAAVGVDGGSVGRRGRRLRRRRGLAAAGPLVAAASFQEERKERNEPARAHPCS
jgi:hypothetical protein